MLDLTGEKTRLGSPVEQVSFEDIAACAMRLIPENNSVSDLTTFVEFRKIINLTIAIVIDLKMIFTLKYAIFLNPCST